MDDFMRTLKTIGKILLIIFISLLIVYSGIYLVAKAMPKLEIKSANGIYLYDKDGNLFSGTTDDD